MTSRIIYPRQTIELVSIGSPKSHNPQSECVVHPFEIESTQKIRRGIKCGSGVLGIQFFNRWIVTNKLIVLLYSLFLVSLFWIFGAGLPLVLLSHYSHYLVVPLLWGSSCILSCLFINLCHRIGVLGRYVCITPSGQISLCE
jgi:hypothetical protein